MNIIEYYNKKKHTFFAMISFGLIQGVIFFTNRSQILYINGCNYHNIYRLFFIILYPLGFVIGSLFNQFLVKRFGLNGTYLVLLSTTCIALLSNQIYESPLSWLFFRFIYSFNMASLFWIFNDYFSNKNTNLSKKFPYGFSKLILSRIVSILGNIIITFNFDNFNQMTVLSVILLQLAQIFFSVNNKNIISAKPLNDLKFYIDIYWDLYQSHRKFLIFFLLFIGIYQTYNIWLLLILNQLKNVMINYKYLIISLTLGEILSTYTFSNEDNSISLKNRLIYGSFLFAMVNFLLFIVFIFHNYRWLFFLFFIAGFLLSKINKDLESLVFHRQKTIDQYNFDFSNTIVKNLFNIIILIITFYMANNKASWIFLILTILYLMFLGYIGLKFIDLESIGHKP